MLIISFFACKRNDKTIPIEGKWSGKFKLTGNQNSETSIFIISEQGKQIQQVDENNNVLYQGQWNVNGTDFTATVSEPSTGTYNYKATYDNKLGKFTDGTYGDGASYDNYGTWYDMVKQ